MVVIGSTSRPKHPSASFVLVSSVTLWRMLLIGLALLYPVSLYAFFRTTTTTPDANTRGGAGNTQPMNKKNNGVKRTNNAAPPVRKQQNGKPVIGYAVSITGCGADPLTEGAAVLKHSIHMAHAQTNKYDFEMYAIAISSVISVPHDLIHTPHVAVFPI